jgi:hypothetical protein
MSYAKYVAATVALVCAVAVGIVTAQQNAAKDSKAAAAPQLPPGMQLPPGWTAEDMQAGMAAATPGKMHERLAADIGEWTGKSTMWMYPGAEPSISDCTAKVTALFEGRYVKCDMIGEMMGMPYTGMGIYGFNNTTQKLQATWIDNCTTEILTGTGELSPDGKAITWSYNYNCPINKKLTVLREVHKSTGPNTQTMEVYGPDPKTDKEYKMMVIELTRK